MLTLGRIRAYRAETYRTQPDLRLETPDQAVAHVEDRGFITFWPIKDIVMPNLWAAVAGDRDVPNEHDDPGHVTWEWKDSLLGKRRWYYAKVLRRKATIISLDMVPYFYALSENFGAPEEDYLQQYADGAMTSEAKQIYEVLLREGPLNSPALRRAVSMTDRKSQYRFNRGLEMLQADFKVLPIGVAEAGAWNYAFIYECVHRHHPKLPEQARDIKISEAQCKLAATYFHSVGAARFGDVSKVFRWQKRDMVRALDQLAADGVVRQGVRVEGQGDDWVALADLL
jgi:hypothetical protein